MIRIKVKASVNTKVGELIVVDTDSGTTTLQDVIRDALDALGIKPPSPQQQGQPPQRELELFLWEEDSLYRVHKIASIRDEDCFVLKFKDNNNQKEAATCTAAAPAATATAAPAADTATAVPAADTDTAAATAAAAPRSSKASASRGNSQKTSIQEEEEEEEEEGDNKEGKEKDCVYSRNNYSCKNKKSSKPSASRGNSKKAVIGEEEEEDNEEWEEKVFEEGKAKVGIKSKHKDLASHGNSKHDGGDGIPLSITTVDEFVKELSIPEKFKSNKWVQECAACVVDGKIKMRSLPTCQECNSVRDCGKIAAFFPEGYLDDHATVSYGLVKQTIADEVINRTKSLRCSEDDEQRDEDGIHSSMSAEFQLQPEPYQQNVDLFGGENFFALGYLDDSPNVACMCFGDHHVTLVSGGETVTFIEPKKAGNRQPYLAEIVVDPIEEQRVEKFLRWYAIDRLKYCDETELSTEGRTLNIELYKSE